MKPGQRLGVIYYENRYLWFGLIFFALKMQSCQKKSLSHNMAKQTLMSYVITWLNTLFNIGHWLLVNIGILQEHIKMLNNYFICGKIHKYITNYAHHFNQHAPRVFIL